MTLDDNLSRIDLSKTENFVKLVEISGLDPLSDFRFANFEGMDFSDCALKGFDFTGSDFTKAILGNANFDGAIIKGAIFSRKENPRGNNNRNIAKKRYEIIKAASSWLRVELKPVNKTWFEDSNSSTRVVCTISKSFDSGTPYWFAYHPKWDDFLRGAANAYFILGCLDLEEAFAIPRLTIDQNLPYLHVSQDSGRKYWHIHIGKTKNGNYELVVPRKINIPLEPFKLPL